VTGIQSFDSGGGEANVFLVFNTTIANSLLDPSTADPAKWTCRIAGIAYVGALLELVNFDVLRVFFLETGMDAGADEVSYSNAPSDVGDASGRMLAAFVRAL
jgi:hypothetical protein